MLAVEQHLPARLASPPRPTGGCLEVLLLGGAERDADVVVPGLGDEADGVGLGVEQAAQAGIVGEADARPLGHAEGGEGRARSVRFFSKKARVGRVGAGIAALDIVDAELVEHAGDQHLVLQREVDAVGLRAVAQSRVEEIEAFLAHGSASARDGLVWFCLSSRLRPAGGRARDVVSNRSRRSLLMACPRRRRPGWCRDRDAGSCRLALSAARSLSWSARRQRGQRLEPRQRPSMPNWPSAPPMRDRRARRSRVRIRGRASARQSGVPQLRRSRARAISELMKTASAPRVSRTSGHAGQRREERAERLLAHAAMADPRLAGCSCSAKRTAPHWQPPVSAGHRVFRSSAASAPARRSAGLRAGVLAAARFAGFRQPRFLAARRALLRFALRPLRRRDASVSARLDVVASDRARRRVVIRVIVGGGPAARCPCRPPPSPRRRTRRPARGFGAERDVRVRLPACRRRPRRTACRRRRGHAAVNLPTPSSADASGATPWRCAMPQRHPRRCRHVVEK